MNMNCKDASNEMSGDTDEGNVLILIKCVNI